SKCTSALASKKAQRASARLACGGPVSGALTSTTHLAPVSRRHSVCERKVVEICGPHHLRNRRPMEALLARERQPVAQEEQHVVELETGNDAGNRGCLLARPRR